MPVEIRPVGVSRKVSWLNYGDNGCGKTSLIGSGGSTLKTLIVRPPSEHADPIYGSGVKEAIVRDWTDMDEVQSMLHHVPKGEWDWVWLDSLSMWQDWGLDDMYQQTLDRAGIPGSPARAHRAQFFADKGEYRINMERISALIRDWSGTDAFHFGVTAHPFWGSRPTINIDEAGEQIQPWIQGKGMVPKIAGSMNIVSYMEVAKRTRGTEVVEYRRLITKGSPTILAKCALKDKQGIPIFGEDGILVNPTMDKVMEAINRRVVAGTEAAPRRNRTRPAARR